MANGKLVNIIFHNDGELWATYFQEQLSESETLKLNVFLQKDKALFSGSLDTRSQTHLLQSSVVIVIVTPCHMDFLLSKSSASYAKLIPCIEKGLLFLVGLDEEKLNAPDVRAITRMIFPNYNNWAKVTYNGDDSIKELMDKVTEIIERPDPILSKFTLIPTTVQCEEETTVVALIDKAIPENADVKALVRGAYYDDVLPCQRANPYTYTFVMPKNVEDEVTVIINVDEQSLGSQLKILYKSYISCSEQTAITEIYCHMLDKICTFIMTEMKTSDAKNYVDMKLSEIFDHTVDLPAVGYEKLFGIYQYLNEENSRTKIPNLIYLGAEHDFKELVARLQDLPQFPNALCIRNSEKKTPKEIAESLGFTTLAEFLQENEEQADLYAAMLYLDKTAYGGCYYNKIAFNNPIEPNPPSEQIEPSVYADMTGGGSLTGNKSPVLEQDIYFMDDVIQGENQRQSTIPSPNASKVPSVDIDLLGIQEKFQQGELSMEDVQRAFTEWQKKHMMSGSNSFESKQAALKKTMEELNKVKSVSTMQDAKNYSGVCYAGRDPIAPPIPARKPPKPKPQYSADKSRPDMYLDLPERSVTELGELYDYAETPEWKKTPVRHQPSSRRNSSRSSGTSSGRGSTSSGIEDDITTKRFSVAELNLPEPPLPPRKQLEKVKQQKDGRHH